jgi:hypothetical protein
VDHKIAIESKRKDWQKTYSRMVRFFDGALPSLMGCFPLSAMALGFFSSGTGGKMWGDGSVCEWICRAPRGLFYWLWERIRSDDWLACIIGIPNSRVFSPNAKGFHWTVFMVPGFRIFYGFCAKGQEFFACSAKIKFPNSFKNSKDSHPQVKGDQHNTNAGIKI